jgi:hypothetical protein
LKSVIYTEGTPGLAHFTMRVRQVRRILYWGCARLDEVYTEGTPGFANFTQRLPKSPKMMSGYFKGTKLWKNPMIHIEET